MGAQVSLIWFLLFLFCLGLVSSVSFLLFFLMPCCVVRRLILMFLFFLPRGNKNVRGTVPVVMAIGLFGFHTFLLFMLSDGSHTLFLQN